MKPLTFKEILKPKNSFHWWGLIIIFLGIMLGGAIGGAIGGGIGYYMISMSRNKKYSNTKKFGIFLSLTLGLVILSGAFVVYVLRKY